MKIIVCGAGQVGYRITERLCMEGHEVHVVDKDPNLIARINEGLDVNAVEGHAADPSVLEKMGAADVDMLLAFIREDEVNMAVCQVAYSVFGVNQKIARIRNKNYLSNRWHHMFSEKHFPIDRVVSPEMHIARNIAMRIQSVGAVEVYPSLDDKVRTISVRVQSDCPLLGVPVKNFSNIIAEYDRDMYVRFLAYVRQGKIHSISSGSILQEGDELYLTLETDHVPDILEIFGQSKLDNQRIILLGGGLITEHLVRELLDDDEDMYRISIVEHDAERAQELVHHFDKVSVINGDVSDQNILKEAGVHKADIVITLTNHDEANLLTSLMAKKIGVAWNMALLSSSNFASLSSDLKIDTMIYPHDITIASILPFLRRGRVRYVHPLRDGAAEIMEIEALENSYIVGIPLGQISKMPGIVLGLIERGGSIILPKKDTILQTGDKMVVFATSSGVQELEKMISES